MKKACFKAFHACLIASIFAPGCGTSVQNVSEGKIYGGTRVDIGKWKSTVALTYNSGGIFCSGVAFNESFIITAAHCVKDRKAEDFKVYGGSGNFQNTVVGKSEVSIVEVHPKYKDFDNDIAYIFLKNPLSYFTTSFYEPFLSDVAEIKAATKVGARVHLVGYGLRDSNRLGEKWEVDTKIIDKAPGAPFNSANEIALGGQGKDSCEGDSGGPAYSPSKAGKWAVLGLTSRGVGCGDGGVYTLLPAHLCWLEESSGMDLHLPVDYCTKFP